MSRGTVRCGVSLPHGTYRPDDAVRRHGVTVEREASDVAEAYARFAAPRPAPYRDGSLPGG
jgi:hypothetical protein